MQKVVIVNVAAHTDKKIYTEHQPKELNQYLDEGYSIKNFYQHSPSENKFITTQTYILEK